VALTDELFVDVLFVMVVLIESPWTSLRPKAARFNFRRSEFWPRKNATKQRESFLQGLKPVESTQFMSALKHRPPKEKDFFRSP
jgi:hypothetical protein